MHALIFASVTPRAQMEHVLCSTTVTASSNGTCALKQHEKHKRVYNVHPLTGHVIDQR